MAQRSRSRGVMARLTYYAALALSVGACAGGAVLLLYDIWRAYDLTRLLAAARGVVSIEAAVSGMLAGALGVVLLLNDEHDRRARVATLEAALGLLALLVLTWVVPVSSLTAFAAQLGLLVLSGGWAMWHGAFRPEEAPRP